MLAGHGVAELPESLRRAVEGFEEEYLGDGVPFGGREEEMAALDGWLLDEKRPCALVVAEAGRGKSALLARWVRRVAERVPTVFVPVSLRFGTAQRVRMLRLLGAQLRALSGVGGEAPRDPEAARAEIEAMMATRGGGGGAPWLVVLDGIDEAVGWQLGRDLRLPAASAGRERGRQSSGAGVKVLVSARALAGCDLEGWRKRLGWTAEETMGWALRALDARDVADVLRKMGDPLAGLGDRREMAGMLARVTEGDPLVLRLYVDALRAQGERVAMVTPSDLSAMPPGIDGYLDRWWAEQRMAWGGAAVRLERDTRELLCALATALGPLMREELDAIVPERDAEARDTALLALGRLVIGDGRTRGYVFSHPRLGYYHAERMSTEERAAWERRFVGYGEWVRARLEGDGAIGEMGYVVRHHGAHLERAGAGFRELARLVTQAWQEAWEGLEGSFDGFLGDVERAAVRAEAALMDDAEGAAAELYRLALVRGSIGDVTGNVPGALLARLVEAGMWSPEVALAYANGRESAIDALAPVLPLALVRAVLPRLDEPEHPMQWASRPAVLEALLGRLVDAGEPWEVLLAVARQTPGTRARVLLALAPRLPEEVRRLAWEEIRRVIGELPEWEERSALLLELAAQVPAEEPAERAELRAKAAAMIDEEGDGGDDATLLALVGDHARVLRLARERRDPESRAQYLACAVAATSGELQMRMFGEWVSAERAMWAMDKTSLGSEWWPGWPLPSSPLGLPPRLLEAFVALVHEVPFPRTRALAFARLALLHGAGRAEAAAAVRALDGADRVFGLLAIARVLEECERDAALAEVIAAVRARNWGAPSEAWHRADIDWQLAKHTMRGRGRAPRTAAELLAMAARWLPPGPRAGVLRDALSRSRTIGDDAPRGQALAAMAARLEGDARAEVLAAALAAARAAPELLDRARALAAVAPAFPDAGREAIATIGEIEIGYHLGEVIRFGVAAARSLPEPEQRAAIGRLFEIRAAHRENDAGVIALRALAPHLPAELRERADRDAWVNELSVLAVHGAWSDEERLAMATAVVRAIKPRADRPDHAQTARYQSLPEIVPLLSSALVRDVLSWSGGDDERATSRRTWLWNLVLPRLAELGEAREAVELARTIGDPLDRARVLCTVSPKLGPPLRAEVIDEVMARVRALPSRRDDELEVHYTLEVVSVLAAHGHGAELAALAADLLERWRALSVCLKLAAASSPTDRRAMLAVALDRALVGPAGYSFAEFDHVTTLLSHAAELDRRGLARLFGRALRYASFDGRGQLFASHAAVATAWVPCALEALGGRAAIREAARACQEVAAWLP